MYALDTSEARKADSTGGFIKDIGKYVGAITQAEDIKAATGTRGIALTFKSNEGQTARVSLYTVKPNGEKIMGYQMVMAIMTCLKLRNIEPSKGKVTYWSYDDGKEMTKEASVFPMLCKPIGMLLETEDYEKNNGGGIGTRMVLKSVFQVPSELTASEILDQKTVPEQLAKQVALLRHRGVRGARPAAGGAAGSQTSGGGFDHMDDDIPF